MKKRIKKNYTRLVVSQVLIFLEFEKRAYPNELTFSD